MIQNTVFIWNYIRFIF